MKDLSKGAELSVCDELKVEIEASAKALICELIEKTNLSRGDILVIGCSSSEILGNNIGKGSSFDAARVLFETILHFVLLELFLPFVAVILGNDLLKRCDSALDHTVVRLFCGDVLKPYSGSRNNTCKEIVVSSCYLDKLVTYSNYQRKKDELDKHSYNGYGGKTEYQIKERIYKEGYENSIPDAEQAFLS